MKPQAAIKIIQKQSQQSAHIIALIGDEQAETLVEMAQGIEASLRQGGRFLICGNGGSAGDAQHIAAELSGRFYLERPGLAALALTTNSSALTAVGNDFSFEEVFSRQMEGLAHKGDVLLALTTSGGSPNVLRAVSKARELEMIVMGMTGSRGLSFAEQCDLAVVVPSEDTPRIQEGHIFAGHMLCQLVESQMFGNA